MNIFEELSERQIKCEGIMDFGDYCLIEQKRYGCENEVFLYKVVRGGMRCNYWRGVPVDANQTDHIRGDVTDVIQAIKCGVDETKVETFRLQDVQRNDKFKTSRSSNFNEGIFESEFMGKSAWTDHLDGRGK